MIDPHVHLRDGSQSNKETVHRGFDVAYKVGLNAVFEMPNTNPELIGVDTILERIRLGEDAIEKLKKTNLDFQMFHGIYGGITNNLDQVKKMIELWKKNKQVVGLKLFAGHSTQNMGIIGLDNQKKIYETLVGESYTGVLAVHCEDESKINGSIFNIEKPFTHCLSRPPRAETHSVENQITLAKETGFKGVLHICHISVPQSLEIIKIAREEGLEFRITTGVTPHHVLLNERYMFGEKGLLYKMNPPLRSEEMQNTMYQALLNGEIDWIETDHAPHTLDDKMREGYMSGVPCLHAHPILVQKLKGDGVSDDLIRKLTFDNIIEAFNLQNHGIKYSRRKPEMNLGQKFYKEIDVFNSVLK